MPDTSISNLSPGSPAGTDVIPFSNGTTTHKVQVQSLPVDYNSLLNKPAVPQTAPTGSIIMWPTTTPPTGYIECNGSAISRSSFSALFTVLGTSYGAGNGSTTFNLPDLRGEFIRGWDNSKGVDTGRVIGSSQQDAFQGHWHDLKRQSGSTHPGGHPFQSWHATGPNNPSYTAGVVNSPIADSSNGTPRTASETRPRNIALMYCIKT